MSNYILAQVQQYLSKSITEKVDMPDELIEEFGELAKNILRKRFKEPRSDKFTIRLSNVGKPLCQLQQEASGAKGSTPGYDDTFKFMLGDMTEALAVIIMKAAGVNIEATNQSVKLAIGGTKISGTYDVKIDGKIYDIKSASKYAFKYKFGDRGSFSSIQKDDAFGYVAQGFGYAEADGSKFGGWIAINKETGEWAVTEVPEYDKDARLTALSLIDTNIRAIKSNKAFAKCFEDEEEFFRKKPTGNRTLGVTCEWCAFRSLCWPEAVKRPQALSKAAIPKMVWYSKYKEKEQDGTKEEGTSDTGSGTEPAN
jgi:hypothetical protein